MHSENIRQGGSVIPINPSNKCRTQGSWKFYGASSDNYRACDSSFTAAVSLYRVLIGRVFSECLNWKHHDLTSAKPLNLSSSSH